MWQMADAEIAISEDQLWVVGAVVMEHFDYENEWVMRLGYITEEGVFKYQTWDKLIAEGGQPLWYCGATN